MNTYASKQDFRWEAKAKSEEPSLLFYERHEQGNLSVEEEPDNMTSFKCF
jgi:hypothetical protein